MANMQYWGVFHSMLEERIMKMEHWTSLMIIFFFFFFFLFVCSLYVPKYLNQIIRSETIKKRMDYCVLTL